MARKQEAAAMMLVMWGLLFGIVGLVWAIVIDLVSADHRRQKVDSEDSSGPICESGQPKSKVA